MLPPSGASECLAGPAGVAALALLTDKVTLAQAGTALQWDFMPESVSTLEAARKQAVSESSLAWLAKRAAHRAVMPSISGTDSRLNGV